MEISTAICKSAPVFDVRYGHIFHQNSTENLLISEDFSIIANHQVFMNMM